MASFFLNVLNTKSPNPIWTNVLPFLVTVAGFAIIGWTELALITLTLTPFGVLVLWLLEKTMVHMRASK